MERGKRICGFSLIEGLMVVAIIAVLASMAMVVSSRWSHLEEARRGALIVAGALQEARDRARTEGYPVLIFFDDEVDCSDGRDPILTVVHDLDRSWSQTPPDTVRPIAFPDDIGCDVAPLGSDGETLSEELKLPEEDYSQLVALLIETTTSPLLPPVSQREQTTEVSLTEVIKSAATFAPDATGRPVLAFSPNGSPVNPATPTSWGSGAGAYYVESKQGAVYATIVTPTGSVSIKRHDPTTGTWK